MSDWLRQISTGFLSKLDGFGISVWTVLDVLVPYKTKQFLEEYFRTVRLIGVDRDRDKIGKFVALFVVYVLACCYVVAEFVIPPDDQWGLLSRFGYMAYYKLAVMDSQFIPLVLQAVYFYQKLYFQFHNNIQCDQIKAVLFDNDLTFVLGSRKPYLRWTVSVLNAFQPLMIFVEFWACFVYWLFVSEMSSYPLWSLSGLFGLLNMTVNWLLDSIFVLSYAYIGIVAVTILAAHSLIYFERRNRMHHYLMKPISRSTARRVSKFCVWHLETMFYANQWDQLCGRLMLAYLVANFPLNASIVAMIITNHATADIQLPMIALAIGQLIGFSLIHLVMANFCNKTHQSAHRLMELCARMPRASSRNRVTIAFFVEMVHTKQKFGPHYGPFGLITIGAFAKCLLFYSEFLMFTYQHWVRNNRSF